MGTCEDGAVADKNSQRVSGDGGEVEEGSKSGLQEIVGATTVNKDSDARMVDIAEEAKGLGGGEAGKGVKANVRGGERKIRVRDGVKVRRGGRGREGWWWGVEGWFGVVGVVGGVGVCDK